MGLNGWNASIEGRTWGKTHSFRPPGRNPARAKDHRLRKVLIMHVDYAVSGQENGKVVNSGNESVSGFGWESVLIAGRSGIRWIEAWR